METDLYCDVDKKELEVIKDNPHTAQFFCHYNNISKNIKYKDKDYIKYTKRLFNEELRQKDPYAKEFTLKNYYNKKLERVLTDKAKQWKYSEIDELLKSTLHLGQRKLLLSEIDFLTDFSKKGDVVIYAGASPGNHIAILVDMFPDLEYICIDPREFSQELVKKSKCNNFKITLIQEYFTDEMATNFSKKYKNILFISDIRTEAINKEVIENMKAQARWHKLINSQISMLKLRFPFGENRMKYLDGEIRFQAFEKSESTETRLIVKKNSKEKDYDIRKYEGQMYHFNRFTRCQHYPHDYKVMGMDHCYDCSCEFYILDKYLRHTNTKFKGFRVEVVSMYITQEMSYCTKKVFEKNHYKIVK